MSPTYATFLQQKKMVGAEGIESIFLDSICGNPRVSCNLPFTNDHIGGTLFCHVLSRALGDSVQRGQRSQQQGGEGEEKRFHGSTDSFLIGITASSALL